jgi:uncharacterized membrane protein YqgA involved in biofilm formation
MLGTIVNTATIMAGAAIGSFLNKGIEERYKERTIQGMGFVAMAIGISNISKGMRLIDNPLVFILSIGIGAILGEWINLDKKIDLISRKYEGNQNPVQGIVIGVVLFCVGALSIVGSIESALRGDNTMLYANAVLDGITSVILSINYGISIALVGVILFLWQGSIYLGARAMQDLITPELLNQLTILGGIFILATGINILGMAKIKILNFLPALLIPFIAKFFGII